jgi:hypothetical protein
MGAKLASASSFKAEAIENAASRVNRRSRLSGMSSSRDSMRLFRGNVLLRAQRFHWINVRRTTRRKPGGRQS